MPAYLTIAVGPNALEAKPVVLSRDEQVVTAAMAAITDRVRSDAQPSHANQPSSPTENRRRRRRKDAKNKGTVGNHQ